MISDDLARGKTRSPQKSAPRSNGRRTDTWGHLRSRRIDGAKFRRQVPIGPFVADFCCLEKRLVIELDGGHHAELRDRDESRSKWLEQHGYRVMRFWNNDVMDNIAGVLEAILTYL
ncbi:MAG TPA: endonuclease domain-containing protein [Candidatus Binataceae bacterium]|nr:endonuclease domain-containing protein [Candidatus Binataceae bacterium]